MKRKIKLRAWDDEKNKMVFDFSNYDFRNHTHDGERFEIICSGERANGDYYELELEQFTGQADRNGVEIFEGDILSGCNGSINGSGWECGPIEVVYNSEMTEFRVPLWGTKFHCDSTHWLEVKGNIHENPELLKGGEE